MLAENGLSLGQADVGEQGVFERNRDQQAGSAVAEQSGDDLGDLEEEAVTQGAVPVSSGLVDTFV